MNEDDDNDNGGETTICIWLWSIVSKLEIGRRIDEEGMIGMMAVQVRCRQASRAAKVKDLCHIFVSSRRGKVRDFIDKNSSITYKPLVGECP